MNFIKENAGVVALVILAIMGVSALRSSDSNLAGSTSCGSITCLAGGLRLVSDLGGAFEVDVASTLSAALNVTGLSTLAGVTTTGDVTVGGGTLTVTTTNAATSTATAGCVQTYATSTLTPIKLVLGNANTSASSSFTTGSAGFVNWGFGTCPNL